MIVAWTPFGIRLVTQADHARFAADLLRLLRIPELIEHPRRAILLRAIAEHDNGWWEADAAPRLDPDQSSALDFRALPAALRREIWRRGVERFAGESPYLAALIAAHSLRVQARTEEEPLRATFRAELSQRQAELLEAASESAVTLALDAPWIALGDGLSLAICTGDAGYVDRLGYRLEVHEPLGDAGDGGSIEVGLAPFPLAGATSFEFSCRWLQPARFTSAAALGLALAAAPWRRDRVRVRPL